MRARLHFLRQNNAGEIARIGEDACGRSIRARCVCHALICCAALRCVVRRWLERLYAARYASKGLRRKLLLMNGIMAKRTTSTKTKGATGAASASPDEAAGEEAPETDAPTAEPSPAWIQLIEARGSGLSESEIKKLIHDEVAADLKDEPLAETFNIVFLYDSSTLLRSDTDRIYRAVTSLTTRKPLLLVVDSGGGDIASAYLIAKLCREYAADSFHVVVPRRAKSAATLLCCGADFIHMGSLSELGPIDPQFQGGVPALALKHSIEHLADLTKRYPAASEMFASYLAKSLRIEALGYYERVAESAAQYAERLLKSRNSIELGAAEMSIIAQRLVYAYKDHGFVVDAAEATDIFSSDVVKVNTPEYNLGNKLYRTLDLLERVVGDFYDRTFLFTGLADSGCAIPKRREEP